MDAAVTIKGTKSGIILVLNPSLSFEDLCLSIKDKFKEASSFLGRNNMDYSYVQVAMTIMNSIETEDREYRPLESIKDNYPKYVITRNDLIQHRSGIFHVNIAPFMKENQLF